MRVEARSKREERPLLRPSLAQLAQATHSDPPPTPTEGPSVHRGGHSVRAAGPAEGLTSTPMEGQNGGNPHT